MAGRLAQVRDEPQRHAVLAALLIVVLALVYVITTSRGGSYEVTAVFDNTSGLVSGADVEVAGIEVGQVEEITLSSDGVPEVRISIDDDYRLRQGAFVNLRALSASGQTNRFISVVQGDGVELPEGARIGRRHTDQPVEVDEVLSTLDPPTRAAVRATLRGLDEATSGRGGDLRATLRHSAAALGNTADVVAEVGRDREALRSLVRSGARITNALAADPAELGATADRLAATLTVTARRQSELALSTDLLPAGLRSPRLALERVDSSVADLRRLVRRARPAVERLVPFAWALRPTLADARPALGEAAGLVGEAPAELRRMQGLLDAAAPTLRQLTPALRSAAPILNEVRVRTPDFFSFFSNWADFTSVYDANGHAARVGIVLPPAPNNLIGPSDDGAGSLAAPFVRTPGVLEGEPWTGYRASYLGEGGK